MSGEAIGRVLLRDIGHIARAGALTGSAAGFAGLIAANGSGATAGETAASWTWLLVVALPLALALITALEARRTGGKPYLAPNALALVRVLLVIGLVGGAGGVILEFVVASYIPTLFSFWRLDAAAVRSSLIGHYPLIAVSSALGTTVAMAIGEGAIWRLKAGSGRK